MPGSIEIRSNGTLATSLSVYSNTPPRFQPGTGTAWNWRGHQCLCFPGMIPTLFGRQVADCRATFPVFPLFLVTGIKQLPPFSLLLRRRGPGTRGTPEMSGDSQIDQETFGLAKGAVTGRRGLRPGRQRQAAKDRLRKSLRSSCQGRDRLRRAGLGDGSSAGRRESTTGARSGNSAISDRTWLLPFDAEPGQMSIEAAIGLADQLPVEAFFASTGSCGHSPSTKSTTRAPCSSL